MTHPQNWRIWADHLHRLGIGEGVASILEAAGSLTLVMAQFIHVGQPIISSFVPKHHIESLAGMLEDPAQAQGFAAFLREEYSH